MAPIRRTTSARTDSRQVRRAPGHHGFGNKDRPAFASELLHRGFHGLEVGLDAHLVSSGGRPARASASMKSPMIRLSWTVTTSRFSRVSSLSVAQTPQST
jgi:hypothetical protein